MKQKQAIRNTFATALKLTITALVAAIVIMACQKNSSPNEETGFNVLAAKEWYYGVFKKSSEFLRIDFNSPFAPDNVASETAKAKYPNWKKAISYTNNGVEYVEMPLVYNTKTILLPGMKDLPIAEKERLANASLTRLLFAKRADGQIVVRTVTIIPTLGYAKQKGYDITSNTLNHYDTNFSGFVIVKDWNEEIIKAGKYNNGKIERKMQFSLQKTSNQSAKTLNRMYCEWVWVPKIFRVCAYASNGDNPSENPEECDNWQEVESPTQGTWEWSCTEVPDETTCDYNLATSCECQLYGIGCDGGGDGDDSEKCKQEFLNNPTSLSDGSSIASIEEFGGPVTDITNFRKNKPRKWTCLTSSNGWILSSIEEGIIELVSPSENKWQWVSLTHNDITKTGMAIGGTVTPSKGVGTPSFVAGNSNVLYAAMSVNFDVTYAPICNCPGINLVLPPYTLTYTSTSPFWDAKPNP